jgi:MFS family permease
MTDLQIGVLQGAAFAFIYAVAAIPMGRIADSHSRRNLLIGGVTVWSAGTIACAYMISFNGLFAARICVGIGEAVVAPVAVSMIADLFPRQRRGLATGCFIMAMMIGAGGGLAIGGSILRVAQRGGFADLPSVGSLSPWRQVFGVMGLYGVLVVALLSSIREPRRRHETLNSRGMRIADLRHYPGVIGIIVSASFCAVGDYTILSWAPTLLSRRFAMSADEIGLLLGTSSIVGALASPITVGVLTDRLVKGDVRVRICASAVALTLAIPVTLLGLASNATLLVVLVGSWTFLSVAATTTSLTALQDLAPNELRGTASALIAFGSAALGLGCGPPIAAALSEHVFQDPSTLGKSVTITSMLGAVVAATLLWRVLLRYQTGIARGTP